MPTTPFLNLFGRSPIRPLEAHMAKVHSCVHKLYPFFEALLAGNWATAEQLQQEIALLESEADSIKRDLRLHLPKGLFLPVSRSDLLELLAVQDRLANKAKDIAGVAFGRKIKMPAKITANFMEFLRQCINASEQANAAIHELDELLEVSFSGNEVKVVQGMIEQLATIEQDTDTRQIDLRVVVFGLEDELPPVNIIFLYKIIEWTGDLADRAQDIGDRLQILLAK